MVKYGLNFCLKKCSFFILFYSVSSKITSSGNAAALKFGKKSFVAYCGSIRLKFELINARVVFGYRIVVYQKKLLQEKIMWKSNWYIHIYIVRYEVSFYVFRNILINPRLNRIMLKLKLFLENYYFTILIFYFLEITYTFFIKIIA